MVVCTDSLVGVVPIDREHGQQLRLIARQARAFPTHMRPIFD